MAPSLLAKPTSMSCTSVSAVVVVDTAGSVNCGDDSNKRRSNATRCLDNCKRFSCKADHREIFHGSAAAAVVLVTEMGDAGGGTGSLVFEDDEAAVDGVEDAVAAAPSAFGFLSYKVVALLSAAVVVAVMVDVMIRSKLVNRDRTGMNRKGSDC